MLLLNERNEKNMVFGGIRNKSDIILNLNGVEEFMENKTSLLNILHETRYCMYVTEINKRNIYSA